jgi:cell division protease FtsH
MHAMAKALLEWETIDSDQLDDIMAGKAPRPPKDWTPRAPPRGRWRGGGTPAGSDRPGPTVA